MKKLVFIAGILFVALTSLSFGEGKKDVVKKVAICHIPPGNPANAHTIVVSVNAIPAHLAHGDAIGACDPCIADPNHPDCN